MNLASRAIAGARWSALTSAVLGVLGILQLLILARLLGPARMGTVAMAMMVVWFAELVANLGLSDAIIYRKDPTREELSSLYWLNVAFGIPVAAAMVLAAPWIARFFGTPQLVELIPVIAIAVIVLGFGSQFKALVRKELHFGYLALAEISGTASGFVVAVVAAVAFDQGVWSLIWGALVTACVTTAVFLWYGWSRPDRPRLHFSLREIRPYLDFGKYRVSASLLNFVNTRADQALIGAVLGPHALGIYSVAFNVAKQPVSRIAPVIDHVAFPVLSKVQDDRPRLRYGYLRMLGILMFLLSPALIGLAVVAPVAVPLVLGGEWMDAVPIIQILAFTALLTAMAGNTGSLTKATGYVNWTFYWQLALFLVMPPVIYLAARSGSLATVAASLLGMQILLFLALYRLRLRPIVGPHFGELLQVVGRPIATSGLMAAGLAALSPLLRDLPEILELVALVACGAVLYVLLSLLLQRSMVAQMRSMIVHRTAQVEPAEEPTVGAVSY